MCRAVSCKTCGKRTWVGCGQHVDAVMATVPRADRCTCPPGQKPANGGGLFASLFGRRG